MQDRIIPETSKQGRNLASAIRKGRPEKLAALLTADPGLAKARIRGAQDVQRSLLHIAADWPGHIKNAREVVDLLVKTGADVNARLIGPHAETPLHWAASSDDVATLDALLDNGADIEAEGAVITGGTPMSDAVVFAQWNAARRLAERGAKTTVWQAAALGLTDRVQVFIDNDKTLSSRDITNALWNACRGGQLETARYLADKGADLNWVGHDNKTPLTVARESKNKELIRWLRERGAR